MTDSCVLFCCDVSDSMRESSRNLRTGEIRSRLDACFDAVREAVANRNDDDDDNSTLRFGGVLFGTVDGVPHDLVCLLRALDWANPFSTWWDRQLPIGDAADGSEHLRVLQEWSRSSSDSYARRLELFDPRFDLVELARFFGVFDPKGYCNWAFEQLGDDDAKISKLCAFLRHSPRVGMLLALSLPQQSFEELRQSVRHCAEVRAWSGPGSMMEFLVL